MLIGVQEVFQSQRAVIEDDCGDCIGEREGMSFGFFVEAGQIDDVRIVERTDIWRLKLIGNFA